MTVDEIVKQIQNGHDELYSELWEQTHHFIELQAAKYCRRHEQCGIDQNGKTTIVGGVSVDDLCQAGFFALRTAVSKYDPAGGAAFLTFLSYWLRNAFADCCGLRTGHRKTYIGEDGRTHTWFIPDQLDNCDSLDAPVPGTEDLLLSDTIPDSREYIETAEERVFTEQLHTALEDAMDKLPHDEGYTLRAEYFGGRDRQGIAEDLGVSNQRIAQLHNRALHLIRTSSSRRKLEAYLDDRTNFFIGMGYKAYEYTQSSAVERLVIHREIVEKHYIRTHMPQSE